MLICERCETPGIRHSSLDDCAAWPRCPRCGAATKPDASDTSGSWKPIRLELGLCNICAIREERAREYVSGKAKDTLIIDGYTYGADRRNCVPLGNKDPHPGAQFRGMAGRRFDIERFDGSPPFSCYSLWAGGAVDEWSRDRMPDNARFLNGARRSQVGEITCFDSSKGRPQ